MHEECRRGQNCTLPILHSQADNQRPLASLFCLEPGDLLFPPRFQLARVAQVAVRASPAVGAPSWLPHPGARLALARTVQGRTGRRPVLGGSRGVPGARRAAALRPELRVLLRDFGALEAPRVASRAHAEGVRSFQAAPDDVFRAICTPPCWCGA
eukprot:CAMPEP_0113820762 /NCGR_PEP_ID=MMETSP0328-20130328/1402_1 /TAXON_ID=39455 /ORGANISM="Alexandrium minutum" /LENGTH=154 /DNA_ID=CAMNT_0000788697 /DNA_START=98 /DNA_END=562 /DNA_ORIENTATION=- /assembly_acc=CAM_ASM_000350